MRLKMQGAAALVAASIAVSGAAGAQGRPDLRLLGFNSTLLAVCNVGCSTLTLSFALTGTQATDNTGASVPAPVLGLQQYLRNLTFQIYGTNPTVTGIGGLAAPFTATYDNSPANFAAIQLNYGQLPLTASSVSFVVNLGPNSGIVGVGASGIGYVDANLGFRDGAGMPVPVPPALPNSPAGPYYQTADYSNFVSESPGLIITSTPEPATVALLATGLFGLVVVARRRRES